MVDRCNPERANGSSVGMKLEDDQFDLPTDDEQDDTVVPQVCVSFNGLIKTEYNGDDYSTEGQDDHTADGDCNFETSLSDGASDAGDFLVDDANVLHELCSLGSSIRASAGEGTIKTEVLTEEDYHFPAQIKSRSGGLKTEGINESLIMSHEDDGSHLSRGKSQSTELPHKRCGNSGQDAVVTSPTIDDNKNSLDQKFSTSADLVSAGLDLSPSSHDSLVEEAPSNHGESVSMGMAVDQLLNIVNIHIEFG